MLNSSKTPILPAHIEETVQAISRVHAEHYRAASPLQKITNRLITRVGRPQFLGVLTAIVAGWVAFNLVLMGLGRKPLDEPPFFWMQGAVGLAALYTTSLILITQRYDDQLSTLREQLSLELNILSEQKAAKIIELLEELRRDHPSIRDRVDQTAAAMSAPADPEAVLAAIKETQEEATSSENHSIPPGS